MKDRYLFRGKRVDNGKWEEGNLIRLKDERGEWVKSIIIPTIYLNMFKIGGSSELAKLGFVFWLEVDPDTICQCTGLRDKNGKLIWENDILSGFLDDEFPEDETRVRVVWYENGWHTKQNGCNDYEKMDDWDSEHFEVIGSVVDNPVLWAETELENLE